MIQHYLKPGCVTRVGCNFSFIKENKSDIGAQNFRPSRMENFGLFGLLEVVLTATYIENGDGGNRRKYKHQEKGNRDCDQVLSSSEMEKENYHF